MVAVNNIYVYRHIRFSDFVAQKRPRRVARWTTRGAKQARCKSPQAIHHLTLVNHKTLGPARLYSRRGRRRIPHADQNVKKAVK